MKLSASLTCLLALVLGGCASYVAVVNPNKEITNYHKVFVINNLDDNHQIELMLVQSLRAQGKEVESGPPTMLPEDAQAVVTYQDHWIWDFSDHLNALSIEMRDAHNHHILGNAFFSGPVSMRSNAQDVVQRLVKELINKKPGRRPPPAAPTEPKK